jgi:hypothetical protein
MKADAYIGASGGRQHDILASILPSIETDGRRKNRCLAMQARLTWIKGDKGAQPIQWASCIGAARGGRA